MKQILVTRSSMPPIEEFVDEINDIWKDHWLTNMGPKHEKLEKELQKYLQVPNIALFVNGHSALECVLEAMDLPKGGEIITTPFTFASTTHAIVRKGFEPVFCDIDPVTYTIDANKIEPLITPRTCAILPVHVYGNVCNVDKIDEIARRYNLKVIYDAAHAFGVKKNGIGIGNFGDASMFSFHATKVFNTIEGGAVVFRDPSLKQTLNQWKNFGITGPEDVEYVGGNSKMNEFSAAMGICNLRHIEEEIEKRKKVVKCYRENLDDIPGVYIEKEQVDIQTNYAYFPVVFDESKCHVTRDEIFGILAANNIHARKYFFPLTNAYSCYENRFSPESTPVAAWIANRVLTLPLYAELELEDVNRICSIIIEALR